VRNTHLLAEARRGLRTSTDQTTPLVVLTEVWPSTTSPRRWARWRCLWRSNRPYPSQKPKDGQRRGGINAP